MTMSNNNEDNANSEKPSEGQERATFMSQKTYGDFLGAYKTFSETTSKVVQQAAAILETEVASGVKMANQAESKFPQIERFRTEKPDEIMQRFRRDAHEVVDIFIDVVGATMKSLPALEDVTVLREGNVTVKPMQVTSTQRQVITAPTPVKAGETTEIQISFENSRSVETEEFKLYSTDLVSNEGDRLPSGLVRFNPPALKIKPHQIEIVTVTIAVPLETKPNTYSGLVLASNMAQLRSEILIKVE
jgi:hypothetical protein